jgi:hypothetical protein
MHSKGVVIIYGEGGLVNGENKDWKLLTALQTESKLFVSPPLIKVETFLTPPSVDWKINSNETGVRFR